MSLGIKKWFKRKTVEVSFENQICNNCETKFDGKFCPECGQSVKDYDKPFSFIFFNFIGDFFAFDTRFFRTFAALIVKPGFLSQEYFKGKRIKYAPPFRIFIFASFILFLLLQIYTNKGLTTVLDSSLPDKAVIGLDSTSLALADSVFSEVNLELDSSHQLVPDSLLNEFGLSIDSTGENKMNLNLDLETFRDTRDLRQGLNKLAAVLVQKLETETGLKQKAKLREYIRLCRSPEQAVAKILEYMSWAFFLLLPLFALILKLVYVRRKHNYMRHLVFSIHIHSFVFLILTVLVASYMVFKGNLNLLSTILVLSIPVYSIIAMKKFYGQTIGKVVVKFISISILYNIIFWFTVVIVFLNALSVV